MVRRPSPRLADGLVTHIAKQTIDVNLAMQQWDGYVAALHDAGWDTVEAPFVNSPDAAFIEDQVVVYKTRAVLTRSGAPERRDEQVGLGDVLRDNGYDIFEMDAPATLDGGDVLKHGSTLWVGDGGDAGRSNDTGRAMLHDVFSPIGGTVVAVPNTASLHLKSSVTALPDGTVIGYDPIVDPAYTWPNYLGMPEEPGAHVVLLGGKDLLISAAAPQSVALLETRGWHCHTVDISEFEKLEGCVTCLSVRLRGQEYPLPE